MDIQALQLILNSDNATTIVLFAYLLYRLELMNLRLKRIEEHIKGQNAKKGNRPKIINNTYEGNNTEGQNTYAYFNNDTEIPT